MIPEQPTAIRHAECSCGQLRVTVSGDPVRISMCHCLACQRRTGSTFGVQARYPESHVTVQGHSQTYVRVGDSGGQMVAHFCPRCGSTVHFRVSGLPGFVVVPVGAFADPTFPPPRISIYEARRHAWTGIPVEAEHID